MTADSLVTLPSDRSDFVRAWGVNYGTVGLGPVLRTAVIYQGAQLTGTVHWYAFTTAPTPAQTQFEQAKNTLLPVGVVLMALGTIALAV